MQGSEMYQEVILDHYRNLRRWGRLSPVTDDPGEVTDRDYYTLAYAEKRNATGSE